MKRDLVLTARGGDVVRIDPATLSDQARGFLPSILGGAMDLEGGCVAVALGGNSLSLDVPEQISRELGQAIGRDGTYMRVELHPRPLPSAPERSNFEGDEVGYFRAAARHHEVVTELLSGD